MSEKLQHSFQKLYNYLQNFPLEDRFKGMDPFDGLNSPIISKTFFGKSRLLRLIWIQFFKRSPISFRKLALIRPGYNPQALGLFISAYCILYKNHQREDDLRSIKFLLEKIKHSKIEGYSGACWGYNFNWQARAFYQPKNTPMIVPTTAVFNGLMDAYELLEEQEILDLALSTGQFILNDLNRTYEGDNFAFSYSPIDKAVVYNASLMGSKVLSRIYHYTQNEDLLPIINASAQFCVNHQQDDGHWTYGAKPYHQWIDNFHSGYNLECLSDVARFTDSNQFFQIIEKGFKFYCETFFDKIGRSKYYSKKTYPIDINNPAQLLSVTATLNKKLEHEKLINNVLAWTIDNMQDDKGYFYYRQYAKYTNKINYIRWSQAWMFFGMAKYLYEINE